MWVFTTAGFVSAVAHRTKPDSLMVRARAKYALDELAHHSGTTIEDTPTVDYPFRITVTRELFGKWVAAVVRDIDYDNFKDAAHDLGDARYDRALMQVWSAMYESSPADARGTR